MLAIFLWLLAGGAGAPATGQCTPDWIPGAPVPGVDGPVYAATAWDPDGPGPLSPRLVIGGDFTIADGVVANRIAMWDGAAWQPLGSGLTHDSSTAMVFALTVYNGELIVGGWFARAGGIATTHIARYLPSSAPGGGGWQAYGGGVNSAVRALAIYNGDLIVGGAFTSPGNRIARYNGTNWYTLGTGFNDEVFALVEHNGALIASGYFTTAGGVSAPSIARWNGTWGPLSGGAGGGSGIAGGFAYALQSYNGELYAAGNFTAAGGLPVANIARWSDPAGGGAGWRSVGQGTTGSVYSMAVQSGDLVVAGGLTRVDGPGGPAVDRIARWTGLSWQPLGQGAGAALGDSSSFVTALALVDSGLFAGGEFTAAGGAAAARIARWVTGSGAAGWQPLGAGAIYQNDAEVDALALFGGDVIAGGTFSTLDGVHANRIARWSEGVGWRPLGTGAGMVGPGASVLALTPDDGALVAGGVFTSADGVAAANIVRWSGAAWEPLGSGVNGAVRAVTVFNGDVIAGGDFTTAGGVSCARLARWDGAAWSPLGAGQPSSVCALAVFNGELYAGGRFTMGGGLARWNGAAWVALAQALPGFTSTTYYPPYVLALTPANGELLVGGFFSASSGPAAVSRNISAWTGTSWRTIGSGFGYYIPTDQVRAVAVHQGRVYAGGAVTRYYNSGSINSYAAGHVGRWNGSIWESLSSGVDEPVSAMIVHDGQLIIGGRFVLAGTSVAPHWARFHDPTPAITANPAPVLAACRGSEASFHVTTPIAQTGLAFRWRKTGVELTDGPTPEHSEIFGATTSTLTISHLVVADAAQYDVVITNSCGSTTSMPATLAFRCAADVDCSGAIDPGDVALFVTTWYRSLADGTLEGDFDHNGTVQPADLAGFVSAWLLALSTGC